MLQKLLSKGVTFTPISGGIKVRAGKAVLTPQERDWIARHKAEILAEVAKSGGVGLRQQPPGVRLLRKLWRAGYTLELVRNPAAACGFVLIPRGQVEPTAELLDMYERHHDEAAAALVETCRLAGIEPEKWHLKAAEIVALKRPE